MYVYDARWTRTFFYAYRGVLGCRNWGAQPLGRAGGAPFNLTVGELKFQIRNLTRAFTHKCAAQSTPLIRGAGWPAHF